MGQNLFAKRPGFLITVTLPLQVISLAFFLCHHFLCWPPLGISVAVVVSDDVSPLDHLIQWTLAG